MSVITTADEKLKSAVEHVREAIHDLSAIVVEQCWGHDDYTEKYSDAIQESLQDLLAIRKRLKQ